MLERDRGRWSRRNPGECDEEYERRNLCHTSSRKRDEHSRTLGPLERTVANRLGDISLVEARAQHNETEKDNYSKLHEQVDACIEAWEPDGYVRERDYRIGQERRVEVHMLDVLVHRRTGAIITIGVKPKFDWELVEDTENYTILALEVRSVPKHYDDDDELVADYGSPWLSDKKLRLLVCNGDNDEGPLYSECIPDGLLAADAASSIRRAVHRINGYIR